MRALALVVSLLAVSPAAFADRYVWVNGQRMGPAELVHLGRLRCGSVPDGRYWLLGNGIWATPEIRNRKGTSPTTATARRPPAAGRQ